MMNWILLVMATIAAIVVAMIVGGLLAPRGRLATRTLTVDAAPEAVYRLLREADGPPRWCPALPTMRVDEEHQPSALRFTLLDDEGTRLGTWDVTVRAERGRTVATIAEQVSVSNPVVRFLRSFGGNGTRPQRFLEAVARELGGAHVVGGSDSPV